MSGLIDGDIVDGCFTKIGFDSFGDVGFTWDFDGRINVRRVNFSGFGIVKIFWIFVKHRVSVGVDSVFWC